MSQERLAELVGLTFQQIQKYERGANRIGSSRLFQLGQALQVPVGYFFEGAAGAATEARTTRGLSEDAVPFAGAEDEPEPGQFDRREVLELVRAFNRISDPLVRRRLFELAKSLADISYRDRPPRGEA
jgi:transcriptional regulator with XRE-family HTH domain